MNNFLKAMLDKIYKNNTEEPKDFSNKEIIEIYNKMKGKGKLTPKEEPNYTLAKKVFLDFNEFNQKNILSLHYMYFKFIPQSLLPYPKNYIKCAYYIHLEELRIERKVDLFEAAQVVATNLFLEYPTWEKYQKNLTNKAMYDDILFSNGSPHNGLFPREQFKKLYGAYLISKKEYDGSPSSIDATDDELIHDFGYLPEIEEDVDFEVIRDKHT